MDGYNVYVGARYIPIYDGAWDSQKKYEPLTIVTYQGNSYTSKTYVPEGVNINNTDYWVLTGNYNVQVEKYREEVLQYQETVNSFEGEINQNTNAISKMGEITQMQNKKFIFLGDSVMFGSQKDTTEQSPYNYPKIFSELSGATVINKAFGGACAVPDENVGEPNNYNLIKMVTDNDLSEYDGIFIGYGINDWAHQHKIGTIKSVDTVYKTFYGSFKKGMDIIYSKNPNIVVYIINFPWFTGYEYYNGNKYDAYLYNRALKNIADYYCVPLVDFYSVLGINNLNYNIKYWDSWVHPTAETLKYMGWYLARNYPFNFSLGEKNIELTFPAGSPFNMFGYYDWPNYGLKNTFNNSALENGITMKYAGQESEGSSESVAKRKYYLKKDSYYTFCLSTHTDESRETYVLMQISNEANTVVENQYDFITAKEDGFYYWTFKAKTTGYKTVYVGTEKNNGYPLYISSLGLYPGKIPYLYAPPEQNNVIEYNTLPLATGATVVIGAAGSNKIVYYVDNEGYVNFGGSVDIAENSVNGYITILPEYVRPLNDMIINVVNWLNKETILLYISKNGSMYVNDWTNVQNKHINFSLENIRFKAAQKNSITIVNN